MDKHTVFELDDLVAASFLLESGFQLQAVKPHPLKPDIKIFLFRNDDRLGDAISLYYTGRARVEPRRFLRTLRSLKRGGGGR
jgi:hypothetical protein